MISFYPLRTSVIIVEDDSVQMTLLPKNFSCHRGYGRWPQSDTRPTRREVDPNKADVKEKSSEQMEIEHQEEKATGSVPNEDGSTSNYMNTTYLNCSMTSLPREVPQSSGKNPVQYLSLRRTSQKAVIRDH